MISAGDFRNGITLEIDGNVYQIMEFQHVKPGKGAAFVRTKIKNVMNGGVVEKTFRPTEKFPSARIDRVDMQYLYSDGDLYNFMDVNTYEQVALNQETIGDALKFVKENEMCKICSYNGKVFSVEPPLFVVQSLSYNIYVRKVFTIPFVPLWGGSRVTDRFLTGNRDYCLWQAFSFAGYAAHEQ